MIGTIATVLALPVQAQVASSQTFAEMHRSLSTTVVEMCRGGTAEGDSYRLNGAVNAGGGLVILKKLVDLGLEGEIQLSQEEWTGIEAVVPDQWDQATHVECVKSVLELLLPKAEEINRDRIGSIKIRNHMSGEVCSPPVRVSPVVFKAAATTAKKEALLYVEGVEGGGKRRKVGETFETGSGCWITLAGTGYDFDFYATISYRQN